MRRPHHDRRRGPAAPRVCRSRWRALRTVVLDETAGATLSPAQVQQIIEHRPGDLETYRLGRIAEWSQPRYRVDGRFVALELLVDKGEQSAAGRWAAQEERFDDLGRLLAELTEPAIVVLGPPGAGKSTLLRRYELDTAIRALAHGANGNGAERSTEPPITFFVPLNHYRPARLGAPAPAPEEWLAERWAARYPDLPYPCRTCSSAGRMVLLLDALNEMPLPSEVAHREAVGLWKDWLLRLTSDMPGNRVVFSCRSLDYSQPLSTPSLRVPQVRIEPMSDGRVREFLEVYSPLHWRALWAAPRGLAAARGAALALLPQAPYRAGGGQRGDAGGAGGALHRLRAAVLPARGGAGEPALRAGRVSSRAATSGTSRTGGGRRPTSCPTRGSLIPKLASLAYGMQAGRADGELSQVRVDYDEAHGPAGRRAGRGHRAGRRGALRAGRGSGGGRGDVRAPARAGVLRGSRAGAGHRPGAAGLEPGARRRSARGWTRSSTGSLPRIRCRGCRRRAGRRRRSWRRR